MTLPFCFDLVKKILDYTYLSDLVRLSLTSKFFRQYVNNPLFWQIIVDKCKIINEFMKYTWVNYDKNTYSYPIHNIKNIYQCDVCYTNMSEIQVYPVDRSYYFFPFSVDLYLQKNNKFKSIYIYLFTGANEVNSQLNNISDTIDILMSHVKLSIDDISKFKSIQTLSIPEIWGEFKIIQTIHIITYLPSWKIPGSKNYILEKILT